MNDDGSLRRASFFSFPPPSFSDICSFTHHGSVFEHSHIAWRHE